jgi:hypothetical protein
MLRWGLFLAVVIVAALLLVALPYTASAVVFLLMVVAAGTAGVYKERDAIRRGLRAWLDSLRTLHTTTPLPRNLVYDGPLPPLLFIAEIGVVVLVALGVTHEYRKPDRTLKLNGYEAEWLTSSAYFAANSLRDYGYIPLWQPYLEFGEPLIDNPFSFVLNPISTAPSLLYGGLHGIKISVVLYAILAGTGGWFLGRMLGLGVLGRLLLALLLLGKGNMHAMIGTGYFQLGVTQAYFPWIIGGTIGILRLQRRWPVILTAVMFTLMFWAGNIWYTLPILLSMLALALAHTFEFGGRVVNWPGLKRLALALILTLGLSAITFLPIFAHRDLIGGHPDEPFAGDTADLSFVMRQFFDGSLQDYYDRVAPGGIQFYYSYVLPLWFAALIFVVIPPIWPFTHRPAAADSRRVWLPGVVMLLFTFSWGAGGSLAFVWLYDHVPLMGQWRFVGRALAVASFWLAVLAAMRVDGLWRAVWGDGEQPHPPAPSPLRREGEKNRGVGTRYILSLRNILVGLLLPRGVVLTRRAVITKLLSLAFWFRVLLLMSLGGASLYAAYLVNQRWGETAPLTGINIYDGSCIDWLRDQFPDRELTVEVLGYSAITTFMDNRVRDYTIEADYVPLPLPSTIRNVYLVGNSLPEFTMAWVPETRRFARQLGYHPMLNSPRFVDHHCIWRKELVLPYAYSIPYLRLRDQIDTIPPEEVTPVTRFTRLPDTITLQVTSEPNSPLVVTIQEVAYPGWEVLLDGEHERLEVVGGQVGFVLPADGEPHEIIFRYRPPLLYVGGMITLLTWLVCVGYLLRVDQRLQRKDAKGQRNAKERTHVGAD